MPQTTRITLSYREAAVGGDVKTIPFGSDDAALAAARHSVLLIHGYNNDAEAAREAYAGFHARQGDLDADARYGLGRDHASFGIEPDPMQSRYDMVEVDRGHPVPAISLHAKSGEQSDKALIVRSGSSVDRPGPPRLPVEVHFQLAGKIAGRSGIDTFQAHHAGQQEP